MSTAQPRDLRCLFVLQNRLKAISGEFAFARVLIGKENIHSDSGPFPAASILTSEPTIDDERNGQTKLAWPVAISIAVKADSENPLIAGYQYTAAAMQALFPEDAATVTGDDRLDGNAESFAYQGHAVEPREDGGSITTAFISTLVRFVLVASNPYQ